MADEETNDVAAQETESDSQQTLTMEEVNKLVEEKVGEVNKKWQSNFDKLRSEKEEALKEKENTEKSWQEKLEENMNALKSEVDSWKDQATFAELKSEAIQRVSTAGIDPDDTEWDIIYHLIDKGGDEPLARVDAYVEKQKNRIQETEHKTREESVKQNGRKVTDSKEHTKDTIFDYTPEQVEKMTHEEFKKVMNRSK